MLGAFLLITRFLTCTFGFGISSGRQFLWFSDDFDIRFPFGAKNLDVPVLSDLCFQYFAIGGMIAIVLGGVELRAMYRMRALKFPPNNKPWWPISKELGRGVIYSGAIAVGGWVLQVLYTFCLLEIWIYQDREGTIETKCNGRGCFENVWPMRVYPLVLLIAMPVSFMCGKRGKGWPKLARDLPAAVRSSYCMSFCCTRPIS